jgi:hypothetical protein
VLNPDSAIPRQLSVCGGRNKVQRAKASKAVYLSISRSSCSCLAACSSPPGIRACRAGPANDATGTSGISMGRVVEVGTQVTIHRLNPTKFRLNCRRSATA